MAPSRQSWLDEASQTPLIDKHVQKLASFVDALADGRIDDDELRAQEQRLVAVMKEVEPALSEDQHAQVTKLLFELTAYNVMQTLNSLQSVKPQSVFQG